MGRQPCCDKIGLKRGPWTMEEDHKLMSFILNNGIQCWRMVPKLAGLLRCGKSCRLRWINYLRPDLKRGALSEMEENQIIELHARLGNRWSKIASHFPGRTDNEIKNHWNTRIKKRLKLQGLNPLTHQPIEPKDSNVVEDITEESYVEPQNETIVKIPAEAAKNDQNDENSIHLINNIEMMCTSLDMDLWMTHKETNNPLTYSPSFSMGDDRNTLQQLWFESVDSSILSWDGINQQFF
ncbi:hypothetical protein DH2020_009501 [Rehmannia glutinosa]|uniref:R2R3-MYB protein n=1 Tax=Rehmannia glutinosa TaxID=99300 RepID=A0ABR0X7J2_REHGL